MSAALGHEHLLLLLLSLHLPQQRLLLALGLGQQGRPGVAVQLQDVPRRRVGYHVGEEGQGRRLRAELPPQHTQVDVVGLGDGRRAGLGGITSRLKKGTGMSPNIDDLFSGITGVHFRPKVASALLELMGCFVKLLRFVQCNLPLKG